MIKKILIVSDLPTHPVVGGNRMCIMQYIENLKVLGYTIYFLYIDTRGDSRECLEATRQYWGKYFYTYRIPYLQYFYQRLAARFVSGANVDNIDLYCPWGVNQYVNMLHRELHFHGMIANYIWLSKLMRCAIPIKTLYTHDVFTNRNERVKGANWFSFSVSQEAKAIRRCGTVFSIQNMESVFFSYLSPRSNIVTTYSSFGFKDQSIVCNKILLFFSGGGQLNLSAISFFLQNVFSLLLEVDRDIRLYIGGKICNDLQSETLHSNVELKGLYEDPSSFYMLGDIVINPVSEGSGLKIKTFEAIAHGKVVISDKHSMIGVFEPSMIPVYIAEEKTTYIQLIMRFIQNKELLQENKQNCYFYIEKLNNYIIEQYEGVFNK